MSCDPPSRRLPLGEQGPGLVGLVEDRGRRPGPTIGPAPTPAAPRAGTGRGREPLTDERELEQRDRAGVHGRRQDGVGARTRPDGPARRVDEAPPGPRPVRRVGDPDPRRRATSGRGSAAGAASTRSSDAASSRVEPGHRPIDREPGRHEPGPRVKCRLGGRPSRAASRFSRQRPALAPRPPPRQPRVAHRVGALERLDGADEDRRGSSLGLRDDVQAVVHPVDKVHVGDTGRPVHDRVAARPPEPRVRCAVVLADVRLDLDDPPDAAAGVAVVADQPRPDQRRRDLEGRPAEEPAQVAQLLIVGGFV